MTQLVVEDIKTWRAWLRKHHKKESKIALVLYKRHTGKHAPSHRELMVEAISWGWIDTTIKRVDKNMFIRHFSKRNPKGKWSDNTLGYAAQLVKEGKMRPEGLRFYTMGKGRPTHDHGIPKSPDMPALLKKALAKNKVAKKNFETFPPSTKKMFYRWILRGKQESTQLRRIARVVAQAKAKNKRL